MVLVLEKPSAERIASYRSLVKEFVDAGEHLVPFTLEFPSNDVQAFLDHLAACERGERISDGFVPHSTFWLVADGEVVAVSNLRHHLTDRLRRCGGSIGYGVRPSARRRGYGTAILRRTVDQAKARGLAEVLITCDADNYASIGTIEAAGGSFVSEEALPDLGLVAKRFLIRI